MQNSIIAFANVIVQSNINVFRPDTVAGCGTYSKLEGFAFLPITCYTMALTTFVSQNLGAGKYDRAKKRGSVFGIVSCVVMAEVIGVLMLLLARPLLSFFTKNQAAIAFCARQIQVEALFFCMLSFFALHRRHHARRGASDGADVRHARRVVRPARDLYQRRRAARRRELGHLLGLPLTWTVSSIVFLLFYLKSDWIHGFDKKRARRHITANGRFPKNLPFLSLHGEKRRSMAALRPRNGAKLERFCLENGRFSFLRLFF